MKPQATVRDVTAGRAKDLLGVTTREAVVAMCNRGEFPGAYKVDPDNANSPWMIPMADIEALIEKRSQKKERAAAAKA